LLFELKIVSKAAYVMYTEEIHQCEKGKAGTEILMRLLEQCSELKSVFIVAM
jgi:hypothetical protein